MVGGMKRFARALKAVVWGRQPTLASGSLRLAGAVAAVALAGALGGQGAAQPAPPGQVFWPDQGWTPEVRARYHHQSQGTATLPIPASWFLAVERPNRSRHPAGLFSDPAYLDTFGFIAIPGSPDGLPIGFARTTGINPVTGDANDPRTGQPNDWIGFTCAACHTARIDFNATSIIVDGGPALIDLGEFGSKLGLALGETLFFQDEFDRFANRVLPANVHGLERLRLKARLRIKLVEVVAQGLGMILQNLGTGGTTEGSGRLDALNRIGNTVFSAGMGLPQNNVPVTAPVAFPHIWDTSWYLWVQYNGSIEQPMVRNAGEAMGVAAIVNYNGSPASPRFTSTIPVHSLHDDIEHLIAGERAPQPARRFSGLRSPAWPEQILGPIDPALASRGAALYGEVCQGCHLPAPNTDPFWTDSHWVELVPGGDRYLNLNQVPISRVGTDPAQARDMANRNVWVRASVGLPGHDATNGNLRRYSFGPALGELVAKVTNRWYDANNVSQAERDRLNGNRPNGIRHPLEYKARPLNGIWATAPYLHNGSVPTLMALLSPQRPATFRLGSRAFDPVNVGFADGGNFTLDTTRPGNSNAGHFFNGPPGIPTPQRPPGVVGRSLSVEERMALIEYLKTL
jgi:mono/diheme cytochrome c family protein